MNQQLPNTSANQKTTPSAIVTCMQLGNVYLLLGMCAVGVLWQTTDVKVLRNYVVALAIADIGHLYITYVVMGQAFFDVMGWNTTAAGNIGITVSVWTRGSVPRSEATLILHLGVPLSDKISILAWSFGEE